MWTPPPPVVLAAPTGPVPRDGLRIGARAIDALIELIVIVVAMPFIAIADRPFTTWAIIWLLLLAYEAGTVLAMGTTPGKAALSLRIVPIGGAGRPDAGAIVRRGAVSATLASIPVIGWIIWLLPTLGDPLGRGIPDRTADTMVVPVRAQLPVRREDLAGYVDGARAPRLTPFGRVGDLDVRGRARLRRLVDAPLLGAAVGLLALAPALPVATGWAVLASSLGWLVVFVIDETRRVHRTGQTAGHALAGLVIIDQQRGTAPSTGRSFARALVLALTLYVPLLWWLLAISLGMMRWSSTGRSLHDLAGGTVVVGDPRLSPEAQRQRSMRLRLGKAA